PILAAHRRGFRLRPRLDRHSEELARFWHQGAWAAAYLALTQALLVTVLVLANRVEGGVVAYQLGFTFFLLPHALVAIPVFTALFPGMARAALAGDGPGYADLVRRGVTTITVLVLPASAALVALAHPLARLTLFGHGDDGVHQVALATAAFAPGLVPYGVFLLLTRAAYARNDARLPAMVNLVATVIGIAGMIAVAMVLHGDARIAGLAAAHSMTYLVGSVVLAGMLRRDVSTPSGLVPLRTVAVAVAAAVGASIVMVLVASRIDLDGRVGALVALVTAAGSGLVLYVAVILGGGIGDPRRLLSGGPARG
ncbi:MAG: lipid II flippase MurJ, partial [Acidimicrobiales bacterium]